VDRCHAKLDSLLNDEEFKDSLVAKAYPKTDQKVNNFMAALIPSTNPAASNSSKTDSKGEASANLPQNE